MYSLNSEVFYVSNSFDKRGRFKNITFEIIRNPSMVVPSSSMSVLKQQLLALYTTQGWTMPSWEIDETMEEAMMIVIMKHWEKLCGFFAVRHYMVQGYNDCYYLERLIISHQSLLHTIIPLAALLIFNLPGFGRNKLTLCAISRLKIVLTLVKSLGYHFFCSTEHLDSESRIMDKAKACLAVISEKEPLSMNTNGVLKNTFNPTFTHDNDKRIITSTPPLSEYDAIFLMNIIPSAKEKVFKVLLDSSLIGHSRFLYSVMDSLQSNNFFEKHQRRLA